MRKPPQRVAGHANSDVCSDTPELAARELAVHPNPPSSLTKLPGQVELG